MYTLLAANALAIVPTILFESLEAISLMSLGASQKKAISISYHVGLN
jgi:hypothetical protein